MQANPRSNVFVSYSHKDIKFLEEFKTALAPVLMSNTIDFWDDSRIQASADWKQEIQKALLSANLAILLVSQHFLASAFIRDKELQPLLEKTENGGVKIFWILLNNCLHEQSGIDKYQAAHDIKRPLSMLNLRKRQDLWVDICRKLITVIEKLRIIDPRDYHGTILAGTDWIAMMDLERTLEGKAIPPVQSVDFDTFGFTVDQGRVVRLGLHQLGLTTLPRTMENLTMLNYLYLRHNHLAPLPEIVTRMKWLKVLDLRDNRLSTLPLTIEELTSLEELWIGGNELTDLPTTIGHLKLLRKLMLCFNRLESLPDTIGELISLITLDLGANKLSSLPDTIIQLASLKELLLTNNILSTLPVKLQKWIKELDKKQSFRLEPKFLVEPNNLQPQMNLKVLEDLKKRKGPNLEDLRIIHKYYQNGNFKEGLAITDALLELFGENNTFELLELKAEGLVGLGNDIEAIKWFTKANDFDFNTFVNSPRDNVYSTYFGTGNPLAYEKEWRVSLSLRAGLILRRLGRWDEAKNTYRYIYENNPNQRSNKIRYAESLLVSGDKNDLGIKLLLEVIDDPSNEGLESVARFYHMAGKVIKRKSILDNAVDFNWLRSHTEDAIKIKRYSFPWDLTPFIDYLEQVTSGEELVTFKTLANWLDGKVSTKDLLSGLPGTNISLGIDKIKVQHLFDTIVKLIERMFTRKGTLRPDPEHLAPFKDVLYVIGLRGSRGQGEYFFLDDLYQLRLGPYNPDTPPAQLLPPLFRKDQKIDINSNPFLSRDIRKQFYEQLVSFAKKTQEIDLVLHEDLMGEDYIPPYAKKTKALGSIPSCPHCGKVLTLHDKNYGSMSLGTYADFLCGPPPHYDCHPCKKHYTIDTFKEFL